MKTSKSKALILVLSFVLILLTGCTPPGGETIKKPVIYLYPTSEQKVSVKLEYIGFP